MLLLADVVWINSPLGCAKHTSSTSGHDGNCRGPGVVLVVELTPTSGMSTLQTSQTSYLQKNYYRLVVYVFCLRHSPPRVWTNEERAFCCHK